MAIYGWKNEELRWRIMWKFDRKLRNFEKNQVEDYFKKSLRNKSRCKQFEEDFLKILNSARQKSNPSNFEQLQNVDKLLK